MEIALADCYKELEHVNAWLKKNLRVWDPGRKKISRYKRVLVASIGRLLVVGPKSPFLKKTF